MKIYYITSERHDTPLAEIRVEGNEVEFTYDTTEGKLPGMVGGQFKRLQEITSNSSHLRMIDAKDAKIGLLRYQLENGDIVEITTDGLTCTLNGRFLNPRQKSALMQAIANGGLQVIKRPDITKPIPIIPTPRTMQDKEKKSELRPGMAKAITENLKQKRQQESLDDNFHDSRIEAIDFGNDQPDFYKNIAYVLKYGKGKGDQ